jgi:hypothetical protein
MPPKNGGPSGNNSTCKLWSTQLNLTGVRLKFTIERVKVKNSKYKVPQFSDEKQNSIKAYTIFPYKTYMYITAEVHPEIPYTSLYDFAKTYSENHLALDIFI